MFSKSKDNKSYNEKEIINSSNIIGKETTIEGNISTKGNVRIEGKLYGNLNTNNKAIFGKESYLEGKLSAQNAEIAGNIKGILEVSELLILKSTAIVNGDIFSKKIVFEQDAIFNGKCIMEDNAKEDLQSFKPKENKSKKHIVIKESERAFV